VAGAICLYKLAVARTPLIGLLIFCDLLTTQFQAAGFTQNGGYGEHYAVPADYAIPLPAELDVVEAAPLLCAGLTVYGGFKNAGLKPGQRAAVENLWTLLRQAVVQERQ
jgi:NADPH:quinone reductase-like Zn-dependent oxidoreductase